MTADGVKSDSRWPSLTQNNKQQTTREMKGSFAAVAGTAKRPTSCAVHDIQTHLNLYVCTNRLVDWRATRMLISMKEANWRQQGTSAEQVSTCRRREWDSSLFCLNLTRASYPPSTAKNGYPVVELFQRTKGQTAISSNAVHGEASQRLSRCGWWDDGVMG